MRHFIEDFLDFRLASYLKFVQHAFILAQDLTNSIPTRIIRVFGHTSCEALVNLKYNSGHYFQYFTTVRVYMYGTSHWSCLFGSSNRSTRTACIETLQQVYKVLIILYVSFIHQYFFAYFSDICLGKFALCRVSHRRQS